MLSVTADTPLSQDSANNPENGDQNGQLKRPYRKWSSKGNVADTEGADKSKSQEGEPKSEKVTADGFKIPQTTTPLKKGEFESPYRHYKLDTVI